MTTIQASVAGGGEPPATEHHPVTFWFETPSQDELRTRLHALDTARHARHTQPTRFCPLCGWGRRA